jgi:hypothetical protein
VSEKVYINPARSVPNNCAINNLLNDRSRQNRQDVVQAGVRDDGDTQLRIIQCGLILPNRNGSLEFDIGAQVLKCSIYEVRQVEPSTMDQSKYTTRKQRHTYAYILSRLVFSLGVTLRFFGGASAVVADM